MTARRLVRDAVRIVFALAFIIGLALFLGYAPVWAGLVILLCLIGLVAIFLKQLET